MSMYSLETDRYTLYLQLGQHQLDCVRRHGEEPKNLQGGSKKKI